MKNLLNILDRFSYKNIIVVGDIMLDHYLEGKFTRMSPEAPVPIILVEKEYFVPGGAGNTAVNIQGLGAQAILIGRTGDDLAGKRVKNELLDDGVNCNSIFFGDSDTVEKIRIISNGKHVVRADQDGHCSYINDEITDEFVDKLIGFLKSKISICDAILVSDYKKGLITEKFAKELVHIAKKHKKMLIVDTKPEHFLWFKGCYCIKPNRIEAERFTGIKIESLEDAKNAGNFIKKAMDARVLLTLGFMGMMCLEEDGVDHFASYAKDVFDVTGAGDTVLAAFSLALLSGATLVEATDLANRAAAIVIAKSGTASVTLEELKNSIN